MDWDLLSQQLMRHVQDKLPRAFLRESAQPDSYSIIGDFAQQSRPPNSFLDSRPSKGSKEGSKERRDCFGQWVGPFSTSHVVQGENCNRDPNGMERLDTDPDGLDEQVRAALRKVDRVESQLSVLIEDMGKLKRLSISGEGAMTTIQGRQDRLDVKACDMNDAVTALDQQCTLIETALHGAVTREQMINSIQSIFAPFREKVGGRLYQLEAEVSSMRHSFTQLKSWIEERMATEVRQGAIKVTNLGQHVEDLMNNVKANKSRADGQEAEIRSLVLTMDDVESRLASTRALDVARIRREVADAEKVARRRLEEVCTEDIRRVDGVYGEFRRERESRMEDIKAVCKEVSSVRTAVQAMNLRVDGTHERLHRLEVSIALGEKEHEENKIIDVFTANARNPLEPSVAPLSVEKISPYCTRDFSLNAKHHGGYYVKRTASDRTREPLVVEEMSLAKSPAPMSSSDISPPIPVSGVEREPRRDIENDGDRCEEEARGKPIREHAVSSTISGFEYGDDGSRDLCSGDESSRSSFSHEGGDDVPGVNTSAPMQHSTALSPSSITANEETQEDEKCRAGQRDQANSTLKQQRDVPDVSCSTLSPSSCSPPNAAHGTTNGTGDIDFEVPLAACRKTVDPTKCMTLNSDAGGDSQSGIAGNRVEKSQTHGSYGIKCTPLYRSCNGDPSEEHDKVDIFPEDCPSLEGSTTAMSFVGNVGQNKADQDLEFDAQERKADFPPRALAITTTTLTEGRRSDEGSSDNEDMDIADKFNMKAQAANNTINLPPAPNLPLATAYRMENIKKSMQQNGPSPSPLRVRGTPGIRDSRVATAQCEFCLRRYPQNAMGNHLQVCELRMVQCPYQCGVKVLVRNLDKHKEGCSLRSEARGRISLEQDTKLPASIVPRSPFPAGRGPSKLNRRPPPLTKAGRPGGVADRDRAVTCLRCHESIPLHLVPSHSSQCKGSGTFAPSREAPPT